MAMRDELWQLWRVRSPLKAQEQDFNVFDPFATIDQGITPTEDVEGDFFGCPPELTRSHESDDLKRIASTDQDVDLLGDFTAEREVQRLDQQDLDLLVSSKMDATESEKREYEAQFNDLLGDLDPKSDGHVNGVMSNGDLMETHTTTTTEMHNGEGTVTTVTETKTYTGYTEDDDMGGDATNDSYEDQQSEGMVSSDISDRASEGDSIQEGQGYPPASPSRIEDQLPEFQPPKRYVKPEEKQSKAPGVFITSSAGEVDEAQKPSRYGGASGDSMCKLCGKRVYEMEKMIAEKAIYHKMCFKCTHCKRILSLTNFASLDGNMYCKPHFIEIFKTKGNYEEGFGIERSTRQWQKDASPDLIRDTSVRSEDEEESREITRDAEPQEEEAVAWQPEDEAEDRAEDGIESVPSIRNIKSRFEDSADRGSTSPELRSPTSPTGRYENGDGRKAVRRMTPPRDEMELHAAHLAHVDIERDPGVVRSGEPDPEEELPPAQYTKSMLAKFKSLEDTEQTSPKRSPGPAGPRKSQSFKEVRTKSSPDSGISDSETHQPTINGKYSRSEDDLLGERDVVRETDKHEEEELPEKGFTKSLLAQWRSKENEVQSPTSEPKQRSQRATKSWGGTRSNGESPNRFKQVQTPDSDVSPDDYERSRATNGDSPVRAGVVRETDTNEEEYLPPPSYTKNMLAKFQNIQEEAKREANHTPRPRKMATEGDKQFKWQVKEAQTLRGRTPTRDDRRASNENLDGLDVIRSDEAAHPEEELPPPSFTRNKLAMFKSMEDTTQAAPTPEHFAEIQKKSVVHVRGVRRSGSQTPDSDMALSGNEREQPEGGYSQEGEEPEELPEPGITRNLRAKFQSMQS